MASNLAHCHLCFNKAVAPRFICTACKEVGYCSQKCKTADKRGHLLECTVPAASNGVGYGGDGHGGDEKKRKAGIKAAQKRENQASKEWQSELESFVQEHNNKVGVGVDEDSTITILDTLKQALRQTPQDWWWEQPQRQLYVTALQVCVILTKDYPKAWGDPEDEESAMAALDSLAQTSKLLVKQLSLTTLTSTNNSAINIGMPQQETSAAAGDRLSSVSSWLTSQLSKAQKKKRTHDKDASLPLRVMELRDLAAKAVSKVLERPECSMMGPQDYYRQALRPLAFDTVEAFDRPLHFYSAGGGHAAVGAGYLGGPGIHHHIRAKKGKAKKGNDGVTSSSATVLWKELSTYPTALPIEFGSSIFVRTLENEMDKLRVLIIGPDDSPYANGCFLFDVTMGNDYPHKPPKVQFLTTRSFLSGSDKKVRFNPNLYECGKVCLSLLGTWSGPGWQSNESTLLQILVSMQSLILGVAEPYFNEPGWEGQQGTAIGISASARYNKTIRRQTLQVAILPFLKNQLIDAGSATTVSSSTAASASSKRKDPPGVIATATAGYFEEFADVVQKHFRLKQQVIQKQLFAWLQDDKTLEPLYSEYWNVWDQLEQQWQLTSNGGSSGNINSYQGGGAARRAAKKRAKADAPAVKMKDGIILLDDDSDAEDQLTTDMALAIQQSLSKASGAADDAVELQDSDADEGDGGGKPAAVKPSAVFEIGDDDDDDDDCTAKSDVAVTGKYTAGNTGGTQNSGEASAEGHPVAAAAKPVAACNDVVVDLT